MPSRETPRASSVRGRIAKEPADERPARGRASKEPLSELAVVDAALRILLEHGLDAVTMRRVAGELDTGAASLYVYVQGRDELYVKMLDRVIDGIPTEPIDPARWREQVLEILVAMLRAYEAHSGIARVALATPPTGPAVMRIADTLLGLLLAGGIKPAVAAWGLDVIPLFVTATAVETIVHMERDHTEEHFHDAISEAFGSLTPATHPYLSAHLGELMGGDGDDRFIFGCETLIDGLLARSER